MDAGVWNSKVRHGDISSGKAWMVSFGGHLFRGVGLRGVSHGEDAPVGLRLEGLG